MAATAIEAPTFEGTQTTTAHAAKAAADLLEQYFDVHEINKVKSFTDLLTTLRTTGELAADAPSAEAWFKSMSGNAAHGSNHTTSPRRRLNVMLTLAFYAAVKAMT